LFPAAAVLAICPPRAEAAERQGASDQQLAELRFTPEMARGMAGMYVRQFLRRRYELPEDRAEEAQEMVTRRIMQLAHKIDEPGRELIERFAEEQLNHQARRGGHTFMPPGFGKEFADRMLPLIPEIRELARGVSQDVRPMLPMKQQLKMAGDLMAFKTAVDGFEETIKKWATGEVTDFKDPFRPEPKKDESGQTEALKRARDSAQSEIEKRRAKRWERYLESFRDLYNLDPAQVSTGESILREFAEREQRIVEDPGWQQRMYQAQLWMMMRWNLPEGWSHPARFLLEDYLAEVKDPVDRLEQQFKLRLESIPTSSQRRAAEERVAALLREKGFPEGTP